MGTTAPSCKQANMYQTPSLLLLASCLSNVFRQRPYPPSPPSPLPPQYPTPAPVQDYNPDIGQTNVGGYGVNKDPSCHKVEKVIFKNKCELTRRKLAGHKTRRSAVQSCTRTVPESSRPI